MSIPEQQTDLAMQLFKTAVGHDVDDILHAVELFTAFWIKKAAPDEESRHKTVEVMARNITKLMEYEQ